MHVDRRVLLNSSLNEVFQSHTYNDSNKKDSYFESTELHIIIEIFRYLLHQNANCLFTVYTSLIC